MPESSGPKERPDFSRLLLPADLAERPKAGKLVGEVGQQAGLPDASIFNLQVTVSEATADGPGRSACCVIQEESCRAMSARVARTTQGVSPLAVSIANRCPPQPVIRS